MTNEAKTRLNAALGRRRERELRTIEAMFDIYCGAHHHARPETCETCHPVLDYATRRLTRCVFGDEKPTCANCTVHCYTTTMRDVVKDIMRYAGPRMMLRHPWLALMHLRDGKRPAPVLPQPVRIVRREAKQPAAS